MVAFQVFDTVCSKCDRKLKVTSWNVHLGMHGLTLCPKHLKEFIKILEEFIGEEL